MANQLSQQPPTGLLLQANQSVLVMGNVAECKWVRPGTIMEIL